MSIGKLVRIEFNKTSLPPIESNFLFQLLSFFWNLVSSCPQSFLAIFYWLIGMPKYLNVKDPTQQKKVEYNFTPYYQLYPSNKAHFYDNCFKTKDFLKNIKH